MSASGPLSVLRSFLRLARKMPTENRTVFIRRKVLQEFRSHRSEQDPGSIRELLELADVQLESVSIQLQHLSHLKQQGNLKS
ncbi:hypothetical protein V8C86DRAFT_2517643 [Haematococcus lacustris]